MMYVSMYIFMYVCTVGVKIKFPLWFLSTYIERRTVITIVQRYAKSTVFTLG